MSGQSQHADRPNSAKSRERARDLALDRAALEALLPRYDMAGPRYTSYPTAPAWQDELDAREFRRRLSELPIESSETHALYVHVPFCSSLCHFCACNRVITHKPKLPARYLELLSKEIDEVARCLPGEIQLGQIHLGGGTPTHLTPAQLESLMRKINDVFRVAKNAEISIEMDPRVTTDAHMDALEACGFNRLSLGIQDFDSRVQAAIHREQSVSEVARLVERARQGAASGVNFDLIYGLPHQTEESLGQTLERVIELRPDRIALYGYAHVTWVAKQQRGFERIDLPTPEMRLSLLILGIEKLVDAGYRFIGMDHFALPEDDLSRAIEEDRLHRNFMGYTTQPCGELLAFGPSGISELSSGFIQSRRSLSEWEEAIAEEGVAAFRGHALSAEDRRRSWVISQIMCRGEVSASAYESLHGGSFREHFASAVEELENFRNDGLLDLDADGSFRMTAAGRILLRNAAMLFDAYLPGQQSAGGRVFSRTV
jgi:oxygen-independent coproporphyrinogen-3 oxidase